MTLRLKACIIFSVLCLFVFWTSVASAQQDNSGNDDMINPTYRNIAGAHTANGGCSYYGWLFLPHNFGQKAVMAEIKRKDSSSCAAVLKEGVPRYVKSVPEHADSAESKASAKAYYTGQSNGNDPESAGYFHSWLLDPPGITLNEVYDWLDWWWNGYSVVGTAYGGDYRSWFDVDGWYELTGCCYNFNIWWDGGINSFLASTNDLFSVDSWPWGFNWAWYHPNLVVGTPQGNLWGYYGLTYGGDSSWLLHGLCALVQTK